MSAATGAADGTWNPNFPFPSTVREIAVTATDVYVAGELINSGVRRGLVRISKSGSGTIDSSWDPNLNHDAYALDVTGSDVYVGGSFTSANGVARASLARLERDGTLDTSWVPPSISSEVTAIAVAGGQVYLGGHFTSIDLFPVSRIARLSETTAALDTSWNPQADAVVNQIAVTGGDVFAAGDFTTIGGRSRNGIAKLSTSSSSADATWDARANSIVLGFAQSGGSIYVGGAFTQLGGQPRNRIAKLSTTGAGDADPAWNPGASNLVFGIAANGTDVFAGGFFTTIGGQSRAGLAKLSEATGAVDPDWQPVPSGGGAVTKIVATPSAVYPLGQFAAIDGQPRPFIAKLPAFGDGAPEADFDPRPNNNVNGASLSGTRLAIGGLFSDFDGLSQEGVALFDVGPKLTPSPITVAFGGKDVDDGPASPDRQTVVTNTGTDPLSITALQVSGAGAGDYELLSGDSGDCAVGTALAVNDDCTVRVRFDPSAPGPATRR